MTEGLKKLVECLPDKTDEVQELLSTLSAKAETNLADAYTIMDTLQFQDITAQQIDHAASLLEVIETKLHDIGNVIDGEAPTIPSEVKKDRAFDPNADLFTNKTDQAAIDDLISQQAKP